MNRLANPGHGRPAVSYVKPTWRLKPLKSLALVPVIQTLADFFDAQILVDLHGSFLPLSGVMRLLAEVLIMAGLITVGWNTPYKQYYDQAYTEITSSLDKMGGSLQKNQDQSVKRY